MLLIHDIVEIDAGDTFLYAAERKDAHIKKEESAERIFGLLDTDPKRIMYLCGENSKKGKQTKQNLHLYLIG